MCRLRLLLLLLLLAGAGAPAWSQSNNAFSVHPFAWQQWYPQRLPVLGAQVFQLPTGYLLVGLHEVSATQSALSVVRTTGQGDTLWTRWRPLRFPVGPRSISSTRKLNGVLDAQGNVVLTSGQHLIKLSTAGDTLWTRTLRPQAGAGFQQGIARVSSPVIAPDGNYVVAYAFGDALPQETLSELRAAKIDRLTGQLLWSQDVLPVVQTAYGSMGYSPFKNFGLVRRAGGYSLLVAGILQANPALGNDVLGAVLLSETATPTLQLYTPLTGSPELATNTADGGALVPVSSLYGSVAKLSSTGTLTWSYTLYNAQGNGPWSQTTRAVAEDSQRNILRLGVSYLPAGPGVGTLTAYLDRYTAAGSFLDSHGIPGAVPPNAGIGSNGGTGPGDYTNVFADANDNYIVGGFAATASPFRTAQLTLAQANRGFGPLAQHPATGPAALQAFPNPAADARLRVQLPAGYRTGVLTLTDALGRQVLRQPVVGGGPAAVEVPVSQLVAGLYLLRLTDTDGTTHLARVVRP